MEIALDETLNQGMIAEATMCYTGDILDNTREKYNLDTMLRWQKDLKKWVHISSESRICQVF